VISDLADTDTVTAQGPQPGHDTRGAGTSNRPATGTYTWPPAGTFSWPRTLVLIDGQTLAGLMVDHNIGAQDRETYVIKRVDEDFFEDV
jgi:hypothetical protein